MKKKNCCRMVKRKLKNDEEESAILRRMRVMLLLEQMYRSNAFLYRSFVGKIAGLAITWKEISFEEFCRSFSVMGLEDVAAFSPCFLIIRILVGNRPTLT
ncbi:unnamed protein product [Lathyrus oleraceus]